MAAQAQVEEHVLEVARDRRERALAEQVGATAEPEPGELVRIEVDEPRDRDLAARDDLEIDLGAAQLGVERGDRGRDLGGLNRVDVVEVRRRGDRRRAAGHRGAGHRERPAERFRAVVDPGEDVTVEVDHTVIMPVARAGRPAARSASMIAPL